MASGATELAAWIGAATGVVSLGWNIYTRLSAGPKLRITAHAGLVRMPPPRHDPRIFRVIVQNIGTDPTTLTNISLYRYANRLQQFRHRPLTPAMLLTDYALKLPYKLEVGEEWSGSIEQDEKFAEWLNQGLWCAVHHSFGRKPAQSKVLDCSATINSIQNRIET
jgi:hypothetical protein